jgi:adenylate kinase
MGRFQIYRDVTAPVLSYYDGKGMLQEVNGMADVPHVAAAIKAILEH